MGWTPDMGEKRRFGGWGLSDRRGEEKKKAGAGHVKGSINRTTKGTRLKKRSA